MAALGRPFSGLPLSGGSDFLQPSPAFPGRAFPPGADGAELTPRPGPRAAPSSPGGSAARGRSVSDHCRKKHKREEEEDDDCPVRKKRLTEAGLCASPNDWILCAHQNIEGHGVNPCSSGLSAPGILDVICEEMDQTTGEPQCEVARRRLQEIEDRSRPSMELVLWKPLPELLSDKPKPSSDAKNYTGESQTKHAAAGTAFPQRTELFVEPRQTGLPVYNSLETAACTEEEMEL
ncbi:coiled-coil domain-containing protein 117 isoform X3 [Phacochoerus africanus]|uniref:coiled-coil domain-containing protein 117 isoform X3 n=1 Tax=Phacochoerus africanus TaxID=41426 RepID=UPI001FD9C062|nr:coiled-coil domain-containing protein 117 isoform X3 [Phacochoerus africanus]